ncbi:MAG TPA: sigma factor G inhibitor Gin [Bacillota bacterium]|nr:sigma factor G inhibitor Gin [Bacillota bacterium]
MIHIRQCSICRRAKRVNLIILHKNICLECEKDLIITSSGDRSYGQYMDGVKRILYNCAQ